jgi:hypothetical protein
MSLKNIKRPCVSTSSGKWNYISVGDRALEWIPSSQPCVYILDPRKCGSVDPSLFMQKFNGYHVWFIGDSVSRYAFIDLIDTLGGSSLFDKHPGLRQVLGGSAFHLSPGKRRVSLYVSPPLRFSYNNYTRQQDSSAVGVTVNIRWEISDVNISFAFVTTAESLLVDGRGGPQFKFLAEDSLRTVFILNAGLWNLQTFLLHTYWNPEKPVPDLRVSNMISEYRSALTRLENSVFASGKGVYFWRMTTPVFNPHFNEHHHLEWRLTTLGQSPVTLGAMLNTAATEVLSESSIYIVGVDHVWTGLPESPTDLRILSDDFHHMTRTVNDHMNVEILSAVATRLIVLSGSKLHGMDNATPPSRWQVVYSPFLLTIIFTALARYIKYLERSKNFT